VPWSEESPGVSPGLILIGALLVVLVLGIAIVSARRRRHRQPTAPAPPEPADLADLDPPSRHLAAAEILRAALASRHGPTYRARTTEEILADPSLLALLGPDRLPLLGSILSSADRLKFAGPPPVPGDEGPSAELVEMLRTALLEPVAVPS
jgi:hypothetical protein